MNNLVVRYQNPAVYVEEFLSMKQEGDENVRQYLSRLKGVSNRCGFSVTCTCCKDGDKKCCITKVSYANKITKFKLVSGLSDSDIKEDALGLEVTTLEEIVKAVEVKESAKEANRTLGKQNVRINEVARGGACHVCKSKDHGHTKEDRLQRCPYRDKPCPRCKVKGHIPFSYCAGRDSHSQER